VGPAWTPRRSPADEPDLDPDALIGLVRDCERAGFDLIVWIEEKELPDRKVVEYTRRLAIRDPERRRRAPDGIVLPLMRRARIIVGYLVRARSPFFPDPATDDDRRRAMCNSIADDRRLKEHGR
jgi:hypothetical protein